MKQPPGLLVTLWMGPPDAPGQVYRVAADDSAELVMGLFQRALDGISNTALTGQAWAVTIIDEATGEALSYGAIRRPYRPLQAAELGERVGPAP